MASAFSHAIVAVAIGSLFEMPPPVCLLGAALSVLPDVDAFGLQFGIGYDGLLGHRGLTHSLSFAAVLAGGLVLCGVRRFFNKVSNSALWLYLFLAIASHGIVDAFTNHGLGVALFAPFSNSRYFFPLRPLDASPVISPSPFTLEAVMVTYSEFMWLWLPSITIIVAAWTIRAQREVSAN